jgi:glutamate-1-semialdehyde 2,1-aminomutase
MKTVAIIQARYDSSRLPGKALLPIAGRPALAWTVAAAHAVPGANAVVVATSCESGDDPIARWCEEHAVDCYRGSKHDVLSRMAEAGARAGADIVMRLTADCPFLDPQICCQVLYLLKKRDLDFASNAHPSTWPDGLDCEVITRGALERAVAEAKLPSHREHVTPYLRANQTIFRQLILRCPISGLNEERWTLDTPEDLVFLDKVAMHLPSTRPPYYVEVLNVLNEHPDYRRTLDAVVRERATFRNLEPDLASKEYGQRKYTRSAAMLKRAEKTIPLGTQTFSKSKLLFPPGKAPLFLTHGIGGRVWDVDGNAFVDYISALLPNVLGYCDPDVDAAITEQLSRGISFSLATELEAELAERLVRLIPCAEMVRFGKNGSDATTGAIRLARAFTGRDLVAVCGYHGWQDWYIGSTTRYKGVPGAVRALTHTFPYGDLAAAEAVLSRHADKFAAIMLEPCSFAPPPPGYLAGLKELAHRHGALLIFDEVITGFRLSLGGAQSYFSVTPDLAAFGKAMGNGAPVSAIVGRADVMREMEQVFYSGTFGGEALSLTAAIATIDKMERINAIDAMADHGRRLRDEITALIENARLASLLKVTGFPQWQQLAIAESAGIDPLAARTFIMRQLHDHGVLMSANLNICYAHNEMTLALTLPAFERALNRLADAIETSDLESQLDCKKLQPVFAVRAPAT